MGKVSRPVLEVVIRTVIVADQKWMSVITKSPIETSVCSAEGAESEGIPCLPGGFRDDFSVRD